MVPSGTVSLVGSVATNSWHGTTTFGTGAQLWEIPPGPPVRGGFVPRGKSNGQAAPPTRNNYGILPRARADRPVPNVADLPNVGSNFLLVYVGTRLQTVLVCRRGGPSANDTHAERFYKRVVSVCKRSVLFANHPFPLLICKRTDLVYKQTHASVQTRPSTQRLQI